MMMRDNPSAHPRRGFTLLEIIVILAIIGLVAVLSGLTMHTAERRVTSSPLDARIAAIRDSALTSGLRITKTVTFDGQTGLVTVLPDGRVLSTFGGTDRLTGRPASKAPER